MYFDALNILQGSESWGVGCTLAKRGERQVVGQGRGEGWVGSLGAFTGLCFWWTGFRLSMQDRITAQNRPSRLGDNIAIPAKCSSNKQNRRP